MPYADAAAARRRFAHGPWAAAPLLVVVAAFVAYSLPPYLSLDPSRSRIAPPAGVAAYYPLLVAHVVFGAIAILTSGFQIWPWFRRRQPAWHRRLGRLYVFGGVLPAGVVGLAIGAVTPFGPCSARATPCSRWSGLRSRSRGCGRRAPARSSSIAGG